MNHWSKNPEVPNGADRCEQLDRDEAAYGLQPTKRTIRLGFAAALVCLIVIGIAAYVGIGTVKGAAGQIGRTEGVIARLDDLQGALNDVEILERAFVITGDEAFLMRFHAAVAKTAVRVGELRLVLRDDPVQASRLSTLAELAEKQARNYQAAIDRQRRGIVESSSASPDDARGGETQEHLRQLIGAMKAGEEQRWSSREELAEQSVVFVQVIVLSGTLIAFAVVAFGLYFIERGFAGRTEAERALRVANETLEERVRLRTAELELVNELARDSEARLSAVTDTARVGLVVVDEEHRYQYANRAYSEILHLPPGDLVGQRIADVLAPVYEQQIRPRLERAFGGERLAYELRVPPAADEASERFYSVSYEPSVVRARKFVAVVIVDVTAFKITEDRLRKALQEADDLRTALNEHAIVAMTDPQGRITEVNDKFCEISKYSREELIGQDHRIINSGAHPKAFFHNLWKTIGQGLVWQGDIKNKAKDGSFYWVATTIVPLLNSAGKPRQYVAIRADITARKVAEEARARLSGIVRSSSDAIIGKSPEGVITSWNSGAEKVFGYTEEEAMGKSMLMLFPPERVHEEADILVRIARDETVPHFDTQRVRKNGRLIDVSVTISPVHDSEGRVIGASKIARDITERRMAEEAIRKLNAQLEERVVERTAQLEAANKELEAFSYSVSHDLRSPLRAMDGFSQALLEDYGPQLPEEAQQYAQTIRAGAQKMGALIDDLLAFSRLSRSALTVRSVKMNRLVNEVLEELEFQRRGKAVEIRCAELPDCEGDPALLKQVWVNLLSNAFKYTQNSAAPLVEIDSMEEGAETIYFVKDNGTGFDMRYAGKLFGVFQRLHRAEEYEGTGVGLAIVQRVIHRHGGRVWANAAVGQGATFSFTLAKGKTP